MIIKENTLPLISPKYDPWEAYMDIKQYGKMTLTNIEFTTTTLCNMRCAHCAVGYTLQTKDPDALPIELLIQRLDEISTLRSFKYYRWRTDAFKKIGSKLRFTSIKICTQSWCTYTNQFEFNT